MYLIVENKMAFVSYQTSSKWLRYEEVTTREQTKQNHYEEQYANEFGKQYVNNKCARKASMQVDAIWNQGNVYEMMVDCSLSVYLNLKCRNPKQKINQQTI